MQQKQCLQQELILTQRLSLNCLTATLSMMASRLTGPPVIGLVPFICTHLTMAALSSAYNWELMARRSLPTCVQLENACIVDSLRWQQHGSRNQEMSSQVWPSGMITGSAIASKVIGHLKG